MWAGRFLIARSRPVWRTARRPARPWAASLTMCATVLVLWFLNPYASWCSSRPPTCGCSPPSRSRSASSRPARARVLGVLPPAIVALHWMLALSVDPLSAAWYLVLLVTGGSVGALTALLGCVWLAMLVVVAGIARAGADEPRAARGSAQVYGPGAYAGPGSLGGTESALDPR